MQPIVGQMLGGRYKVVDKLGRGGGGETYTAQDMHRPGHPICVVKRLKPTTTDPELLDISRTFFYREAETLERLGKRHDQIPTLLAHFEQEEEFYLVQDFIEGHPLTVELPSGCGWSETKVIQLLEDLLTTLEFVHSQNVIHRDVKPANIIRRSQDKKLVLIDFGAVKQVRGDVQQTITQARSMNPTAISIGTEGYMPSEQKTGIPYLSSDIYALGMIGIQALTGTEPIHLQIDPHSGAVWQHKVQVSDQLAAVLNKMVRYYFGHRYQSATEALQALKDCMIQSPTAPLPALEPKTNNSEISVPSLSVETGSPIIDSSSEAKPADVALDVKAKEPINLESEQPVEIEHPQALNPDADQLVASTQSLISETKYSQPERAQPIFEIPVSEVPETKYSQPERAQPQHQIPETKYSQPERAQPVSEIPETKYSQPERVQPQHQIPETKYSQPERIYQALEIPETKYSQPERSQFSPEIPETKYSQPEHQVVTPPETARRLPQSVRKPLMIGLAATAVAGVFGIALFNGVTIWHGSNSTPSLVDSPAPKPSETAEVEPSSVLKGDYTQLKKYLNENPPNWEAADRETYEVMLKVAGLKSESQGFFDLTEWEANFTCEDFKAIDQLWSDASDGQLGFSTQNRILNKTNDLNKFYNEVGWLQGQEKLVSWYPRNQTATENIKRYVYTKKPKFSNPPPGHLPAMLVWSDKIDYRFDKVDTCQ